MRVVTPDGIIATFAGHCGERGIRGRQRSRHGGAAGSAGGRRDRTPRRDLHRRHLQPEDSRRLSLTAGHTRTERPMRNENDAGKSTLATMAILFALASTTLVAAHGDAQRVRRAVLQRAAAQSVRAASGRAERRERRVFDNQGPGRRRAHAGRRTSRSSTPAMRPKFSWVVPVDAAPTLSTGTDRLFTPLAAVTQPRFQATSMVTGTCIPPDGPVRHRRGGRVVHRGNGRGGLQRRSRRRRRRRDGQLPGRGRAVRRRGHQVRRSGGAEEVADRQRLRRQRRRRRG